MTALAATEVPLTGPAAPPRSNGELVFEEPWQARLFGLTLGLMEAGRMQWLDFQPRLVEAIRRNDETPGSAADGSYYHCWLSALESLLQDHDVLPAEQHHKLCETLAARRHGHDHH